MYLSLLLLVSFEGVILRVKKRIKKKKNERNEIEARQEERTGEVE